RHRRPLANPAYHVDAVEIGEREIDDRQIRLVRSRIDATAASRRRLDDTIALDAERRAQEPADFRLVLDDENRSAIAGHRASAAPGRPKRLTPPPGGQRAEQAWGNVHFIRSPAASRAQARAAA